MNPDKPISELLQTLNKGQYPLLVEAVRQLGGEIRVGPFDSPSR